MVLNSQPKSASSALGNAWQLQKAGIKVTLIEGSRIYNNVQDSWPDKVLLYNGLSDGLFKTNEPEFLILPTGRFIPNAEQTTQLGIGRCWFWYVYGQYYFEQAPNPDSRIWLADTVDPVFIQRQTWLLGSSVIRTNKLMSKTTKLFQTAVQNLGGTFSFPSWDFIKSNLVVNGHHMGTTRMSSLARDGVVDPNLRVHSMKNLYVAGASVFPSAGISNPTFTIIMFSIRLADHLRKLLTGA